MTDPREITAEELKKRFDKLNYALAGINPGKAATEIIDGIGDLLWDAAHTLRKREERIRELEDLEWVMKYRSQPVIWWDDEMNCWWFTETLEMIDNPTEARRWLEGGEE